MAEKALSAAVTHLRVPLASLTAAASVVVPTVVLAGFVSAGKPQLGIAPAAVTALTLYALHRRLIAVASIAMAAQRVARGRARESDRLRTRLKRSEVAAEATRASLQEAQEITAQALAKLVEMRDPVTGSHLDRLRQYMQILVIEMARHPRHRDTLKDEWIQVLPHASILHDIGKVGVPDSILQKAGRLTVEEFAIMKRHTTVGGATLQALERRAPGNLFLHLGHKVALYHHERWDGAGYPFGLRGEQIPLVARIVALADVYDALTSERPYKRAYSHAATRAHILAQSRAHFDPDVVEAFRAREADFIRIQQRAMPSSRVRPTLHVVPDLVHTASA